MDKPIKIKEELVARLDKNQQKLSLDTRQNLANTIVRKGLDFLEKFGYEELLKIPNLDCKSENKRLDSTG